MSSWEKWGDISSEYDWLGENAFDLHRLVKNSKKIQFSDRSVAAVVCTYCLLPQKLNGCRI